MPLPRPAVRLPSRLRRLFWPMVQAGPAMAGWHALPLTDVPLLLGPEPLLVLAPHPDDESLGCGGLIADCRARGQAVHVLILTDGSGSHRSRRYPPPRLAQLRAEEARAAVAALGLEAAHIGFLGVPDGNAPLRGGALRTIAGTVAAHAAARGVRTICTTWPGDPHRDHLAAYRVAARAAQAIDARLFCYPVWGWTLPEHAWVPATGPRGGRIDITAHLAAKQRAIACHRSQASDLIDDDPAGFRLSPSFLALFARPFEVFIEMPAHA